MADCMQELKMIDAFRIVNRTLDRYSLPRMDFDTFESNPNKFLRDVLNAVRGIQRSPHDFIADVIGTGLDEQTTIGDDMSRYLERRYPDTVRTSLAGHSPQAQHHFSHYLLKRLFASYELIEPINEDREYQGAQHRFKPHLEINPRRPGYDSKKGDHFTKVVRFASLDEAIALAEAYESHPKVQGAAIFCAADWTYDGVTLGESNAAQEVAKALCRPAVVAFAKACEDVKISPTVPLYCLAEISRHHRNPNALDYAVAAAREYIAIPTQDPKVSVPEIILTYLADTFITWDKSEGLDSGSHSLEIISARASQTRIQRQSEDEIEIAEFYEAGFQRTVDAFRIPAVVRKTRYIGDFGARHEWIVMTKGCARSYADFTTALGFCSVVFDAYYNTPLLYTALEIMGEAGQIDYDSNGVETNVGTSVLNLRKTYLLSDPAQLLRHTDGSIVEQMFQDGRVDKMYHPDEEEIRKWSKQRKRNAERETILYSFGAQIQIEEDDRTAIAGLEQLLRTYGGRE